MPAGIQRTAQGDANAAAIALVGVGLAFIKAGAGVVHLAIAIDVQVVVIKELIIPACGPMQVDVLNFATVGHGLAEQLA